MIGKNTYDFLQKCANTPWVSTGVFGCERMRLLYVLAPDFLWLHKDLKFDLFLGWDRYKKEENSFGGSSWTKQRTEANRQVHWWGNVPAKIVVLWTKGIPESILLF